MTIRTRLTLTQTTIAAVVVALCVLAISMARTARELARAPAQQTKALTHIYELFDSVGQAVKDADDITFGEDDFKELEEQMARAHTALAAVRGDAHDVHAFALLNHVEAAFLLFDR